MVTINELKQYSKAILGFSELTDKEWTPSRCTNIILNRLPDGNNSFVIATSLKTYKGKEYWEYALSVSQRFHKKVSTESK